MVDVVRGGDDPHLIFCRFWPGFRDVVPYDRLGVLPDDELERELLAAIADLKPEAERLEADRRTRVEAVAKQAVRRRGAGGYPRARPALPPIPTPLVDGDVADLAKAFARVMTRFQGPMEVRNDQVVVAEEERRLIEDGRTVGWIGTPDDSYHAMLEDWGPAIWSRQVWLAVVPNAETAALVLDACGKWMCTIRVMGRDGAYLLAPLNANCRLAAR
jgi:hypothetical protein